MSVLSVANLHLNLTGSERIEFIDGNIKVFTSGDFAVNDLQVGNAFGNTSDQANTARDQANSAYTQANTVYVQANTARDHANSAFAKANTGFSEIISNASVGTGANYTIDSSTITKAYKRFDLYYNRLSINGGTSRNFYIQISNNNGTTIFGDVDSLIGGPTADANVATGIVSLSSCDLTADGSVRQINAIGSTDSGLAISGFPIRGFTLTTTGTGYINWIRIAPTSGAWDNGFVTLYGFE